MTQGDMILAWQQRQEFLANNQFELDEPFRIEDFTPQDAYVSEEERWEELCQLPNSRQS